MPRRWDAPSYEPPHLDALPEVATIYNQSGYCGYHDKHGRNILIYVRKSDRTALEFILTSLRIGKIYGPYKNGSSIWSTGGYPYVQAVVAMLWPWLIPTKREKAAEALLGWQQAKKGSRHNRPYYDPTWGWQPNR